MGRGKSRRSLELIEACHEILAEIHPASVRAVCYRLFTRGLLDAMTKAETNRVSRQLTDAREDGVIPWAWVVDETRSVERVSTWADPEAFADTVTRAYRRNKWAAQPVRIEVWSEKGTVRGTLAPVLNQYEVPFRVMHGYASATAVQDAAQESLREERPWIILYCGDFDPSGLHMSTMDLPWRLSNYRRRLGGGGAWTEGFVPDLSFREFSGFDEKCAGAPPMLEILRLALTIEDISDSELPSFSLDTKRGDPRHKWYRDDAGYRECWELDALSPVVLRERVEAAILARLDRAAWDCHVQAEGVERESITRTVRRWRGVQVPA